MRTINQIKKVLSTDKEVDVNDVIFKGNNVIIPKIVQIQNEMLELI